MPSFWPQQIVRVGSSTFSVKPSIFWSWFCQGYDCYLDGCLTNFFFLGSNWFLKRKHNQLSRERIGFKYVIFAVHLNQIKICHEKELDLRFFAVHFNFQPNYSRAPIWQKSFSTCGQYCVRRWLKYVSCISHRGWRGAKVLPNQKIY